jgi:hypothetical protein
MMEAADMGDPQAPGVNGNGTAAAEAAVASGRLRRREGHRAADAGGGRNGNDGFSQHVLSPYDVRSGGHSLIAAIASLAGNYENNGAGMRTPRSI